MAVLLVRLGRCRIAQRVTSWAVLRSRFSAILNHLDVELAPRIKRSDETGREIGELRVDSHEQLDSTAGVSHERSVKHAHASDPPRGALTILANLRV
jgi:hypothetical protein